MAPKVEKKFTREYKVKEIQKNLIKKARLKKEYLKTLKKEGYSVPEKDTSKEKFDFKKSKQQKAFANKKRFDEKKELNRQKKKSQHEKAERRREEEVRRIKEVKEKERVRETRTRKLNQRTRTGQPLMGPKIEDLLDKIKSDDTYTT